MVRLVVVPPVVTPEMLAEVKAWVGLAHDGDDDCLRGLLAMAIGLCAEFIGAVPLVATLEEKMTGAETQDWRLVTRPVRAVLAVESVAEDGSRLALSATQFSIEIDAEGGCGVRLAGPLAAAGLVVRCTAGMAEEWTALPPALCHGIVRMAAHAYRCRDNGAADMAPPAAIAALWQPWRRMRLV